MRKRAAYLVLAALWARLPLPAAQPPASFPEVVAQAPAVVAARLNLAAALARQESAGRFPDPRVAGMYAEKQTPDEEFPMYDLTLEQPLPKAGERAADRRRAAAAADMAAAEFAQMAGEVAADAATRIAEADTARQRQALLLAQITRLEHALAAVDARVAAGQGRLAERLAITTRMADMRLMAAREDQMAANAVSAARARLGLPADAPLPPFDAPAVAGVSPDRSPVVQLANARAADATAMAAMARAGRAPMTAIGLRLQREAMADGDEDTVGVALMTEIPWRAQRYARAETLAALAEQDAARAEADAASREVTALLERVARAEQLAATARDLATGSENRLAAEYESLLRTAGTAAMNDATPVLMLTDLLERSTDVALQVIETEQAARTARAALWVHAPDAVIASNGDKP